MELRAWYVPVSAHPEQVRPRQIGETRPVEPTEMTSWGRLLPVLTLAPRMLWPNRFLVKVEDARHVTSLPWPG